MPLHEPRLTYPYFLWRVGQRVLLLIQCPILSITSRDCYYFSRQHLNDCSTYPRGNDPSPLQVYFPRYCFEPEKCSQTLCRTCEHHDDVCLVCYATQPRMSVRSCSEEMHAFSRAPARVDALERHSVAQVACGWKHTAARTEGGLLFTWGWGGAMGAYVGEGGSGGGQLVSRPKRLLAKSRLAGGPVPKVKTPAAATVALKKPLVTMRTPLPSLHALEGRERKILKSQRLVSQESNRNDLVKLDIGDSGLVTGLLQVGFQIPSSSP